MAKQTQIDRAIDQLEAKIAGVQEAITVLRQQQTKTARKPKAVARIAEAMSDRPAAPRS